MSADRFFVDTNVLLYSFDSRDLIKRQRARSWVDWLWQNAAGYLSWQVLQEFYYNAAVKFSVPAEEARAAVRSWTQWRPPDLSIGMFERAWFWMDQAGISFWDAFLVAAAERSGCRWLLSEDFQAGRKFGALTVINPFTNDPAKFVG